MKNIFTALAIICFAACGQIANKHERIQDSSSTEKNADTLKAKTEQKKSIIDNNILSEIKKYYQKKYGKGTSVEEIKNDTIINIIYNNIPKGNDSNKGFLISIYIPVKEKINLYGANPILSGDLNNDKTDDIIITVHTEGGGNGGNTASQDIFVFLNINNNYQLACITPDSEICGCNDLPNAKEIKNSYGCTGIFRAKEIQNGYLIGNSSCYGKSDARCCPSLNYSTKVKLHNDKLVFQNKEKIK